jgi:hypothetical protein
MYTKRRDAGDETRIVSQDEIKTIVFQIFCKSVGVFKKRLPAFFEAPMNPAGAVPVFMCCHRGKPFTFFAISDFLPNFAG